MNLRSVGPRALPELLSSVVGGAAWGLSFGIDSRPWLAWVALAPLVWLLGRRRRLAWAFVFGFVSWLVAMPWIATTLANFGGLSPLLARSLGVLLAAYLAADILLFAWLGGRILDRRPDAAWWSLPALWVIVESIRGLPFGGFPWNLAAYAWVDQPGALLLSSWVGAAGVSYLVAAVNVGAALAISQRRYRRAITVWLCAALVLSLAARFGAPDEPAGWGRAVRIVQPNTGVVFDPETAWGDYQTLIEQSHLACDEPALLVWPESASWPHSWFASQRLQDDVGRLLELGCPVVLNTAVKTPEGVLNAAVLVDRDGVRPPYAKRRLVPFGEYVPLGELVPFIGNLARQAGDFQPGTEPTLLRWGQEELAMAICYEVVFAAPVAEQVRAGATILATITNDAWYGDSSAPHQHLRAAQFRAAENRRPMLRAALTGISAVIDTQGRVLESLGVEARRRAPGMIRTRIAGEGSSTLYSRAPWLTLIACWGLSLLAIIPAAPERLRRLLPDRLVRGRPSSGKPSRG